MMLYIKNKTKKALSVLKGLSHLKVGYQKFMK